MALLLMGAVVASGCDNSDPTDTVVQNSALLRHQQDIQYSILSDRVPMAAKETPSKLYTVDAEWSQTWLSMSPSGKYGVVGLWSTAGATSRDWRGHLVVLNLATRSVLRTYTKADFISMTGFPVEEGSMNFISLRWQTGTELVIDMQPQTNWLGSLPQNIALIVNVASNEVVQMTAYPRGADSPVTTPSHASQNRYPHEVSDGSLRIGGSVVTGLPSPVSQYGVFFSTE
jgi:hypothetical protein